MKFFRLYSSVIPVKGYSESLLYDLMMSKAYVLPNSYFDVLVSLKQYSTSEFLDKLLEEDKEKVSNFLEHLKESNLGFFTTEPAFFSEPVKEYHSPYLIQNCIIEIESFTKFNYKLLFNKLIDENVGEIQIRILNSKQSIIELSEYLEKFQGSFINGIEIYFPRPKNLTQQQVINDISNLILKHKRIHRVIIYNSKINELVSDLEGQLDGKIIFIKNDIINKKDVISISNFVIKPAIYFEALNYNTASNKKLSIDKYGNISNLLYDDEVLGTLNEPYNFAKLLDSDRYNEVRKISNDNIEVCKDCQYRYMCIFNTKTIFKNDKYYKKDKCNFDPYTNTWS